jgi:SAM-dependent methyltransferase
MPGYALLLAPSSNRVYSDAAPRLAAAELELFAPVLSVPVHGAGPVEIGGVPYLGFGTGDADLTGRDVALLSNLSAGYALFRREGDLLRPLRLDPLRRYDSDLITIPKYAGRTNEQFTRLLLNVTVLASRHAADWTTRPLTVLDPLAGRGSTLNQALMYGWDGIGVEVDGGDVDAYAAFLKTWLRHKRIKHRTDTHPVRRDRRLVARRFEARLAEGPTMTMFHADTVDAREFLRRDCADLIVADAPYGVAHGSHTRGGRSRRPLDLLAAAVPVWTQLLRPGGALGISWNTQVAAREDAAAILADAGLEVLAHDGYARLEHRVDQAITRDVLVARAPADAGR